MTHLIFHFMTNFGGFLSIFCFLRILVQISEIGLVTEAQRLGVALFPLCSKRKVAYIFGNMMTSSKKPFH